MKLTKYKILTPFVLFALMLNACGSGSDTRVLGTIEGEKYTVDSFLSLFLTPDMLKEHKKDIADADISAGFDQLASFVVFAGEADKSGFFTKHPDLQKKLDAQIESIKKASYQKYIDQAIIKPMMDKVTVSDKELAPYKKRVQVKHILLSNDGSMKDPVKGKELEAKILQELKDGADFGELAKKYSEDPGTKNTGGLISQWIYEDSEFVPEFKKAALNAKKNHEIIPDVMSSYGLHIIYIENIQNRSASDIKENDPQIYNQVLQTKKNEKSKEFEDSLLKEFPIEKTPGLDLKEYFSTYSATKGDQVLYTINKTISYTGKQFVRDVLQDDQKQIKFLLTAPDIDNIIKVYGVMPVVMDLYAQKKGITKDAFVQNTIRIQTLAVKANLYMEDLLKKEGPKQITMPKFTATDKEAQEFYDNNQSMFSQETRDGKNATVMPLTKTLKDQIKSMIVQDKTRQFKQEEANKTMNFINEQASKHYAEYKITFDPEFNKTTSPAKK